MLHRPGYHTNTSRGAFITQAQEEDTRMVTTASKDQLSEILVIGDDDALILNRQIQNVRIMGFRKRFCYTDNVMTGVFSTSLLRRVP